VKLQIVIASTRDARIGHKVGAWFVDQARAHGKFDVELVDLKDVALPLFDEPRHPRLRQYEHAHTKDWSAIVARADAFVFVVPEYNYSMPPALLNAIDYLSAEWAYKPAGFVSYGGISGGLRSAQMSKQVLPSVRVMPIPDGVAIPFVNNFLDAEGRFVGDDARQKLATAMLDELVRWAGALAPLRAPAAG